MVWPLIAGAGLSIGGGLLAGRSARRAAARAEEQARERQATIQQYGRDAINRQQGYASDMPTGFTPWNVRTGLGGWKIDPTTGTATSEMDPAARGMQDWYYNQSQNARSQLGNFDRQQFAQQEFNRGQGLLQEGRNADLSNMLGMLQRKGLAGFGQTTAGGTSTLETNPMLNSLFDRRNRQDLELMDRSFGSADNQIDRLTGRATGLFDRGYGMNDDLNAQLEMSMRFGEQDRSRALADWRNQYAVGQDREQLFRTAALGGMEDVGQAQGYSNQARLGQSLAFSNVMQQAGGMFGSRYLNQLPNQSTNNGNYWGGW